MSPPPPMRVLLPPPIIEPPIGPGEVCYVRAQIMARVDLPFAGRADVFECASIDENGLEILPDHRLYLDPREIVRLSRLKELLCKAPT